ncbi:hypothetical protein [Actinomyces dentalis]|nr:hypothetical protein [Actinomyces dentalis]
MAQPEQYCCPTGLVRGRCFHIQNWRTIVVLQPQSPSTAMVP